MSNRVLNWVFEQSPTTGNDRLVLIAIADEADDDGTNAYPSVDRISRKARVNKRTTMRCLARLEETGTLIVNRPERRGRGHFNTYVVVMEAPASGDRVTPDATGRETARKGDSEDRERARKGAPMSALDPLPLGSYEPDPQTHDAAAVQFGFFWKAYPDRDGKKIGKANALAVWRRLSIEERRAAHRGASNLADAVRRGGRFGVKDAERFLRGRCWEDWQEPAAVQANGNGHRGVSPSPEELFAALDPDAQEVVRRVNGHARAEPVGLL